ncbi:hypothetical protein J6524_01995 [Bradyrhizobium sp. WSM 1738]|uniref:hypothetical protein n=1 Tax=Bradyrhizobium hereditatis TaxID=2821405 RepID=UPI001CE3AA09|nr:hypothetical protein [Bradyrhizobium hereditatis]MCA6113705.1 hypothetical protein [Bradyrhizobium hereditatis]
MPLQIPAIGLRDLLKLQRSGLGLSRGMDKVGGFRHEGWISRKLAASEESTNNFNAICWFLECLPRPCTGRAVAAE